MKNKSQKVLIGLLVISAAAAILPSCGASSQKGVSGDPSSSPGATPVPGFTATPSPTPLPTPPPSSVSLIVNFPVGFNTTTHEQSSWSKPCQVTTSDIASGNHSAVDITCISEVNEADLFFNDFSFYWTATAGICDYLDFKPFWYWNNKPGIGAATWAATFNGDGTLASIDNNGGGLVIDVAGKPACIYDYSFSGGGNCCSGNYTATITNKHSDGTPATVNNVTGSWGGNWGSCIAGYGSDTFKNEVGIPGGYYMNASYGAAGLTTRTNSNASHRLSNLWMANYSAANPATSATPSNAFLQTLTLNGTPYILGNPYYTLECLDTNYDIRARIRLAVRSWNTRPEYNKGAAGDSNFGAGAAEPNWPNDPTQPPIPNNQYYDFSKWDLWGFTNYPQQYN